MFCQSNTATLQQIKEPCVPRSQPWSRFLFLLNLSTWKKMTKNFWCHTRIFYAHFSPLLSCQNVQSLRLTLERLVLKGKICERREFEMAGAACPIHSEEKIKNATPVSNLKRKFFRDWASKEVCRPFRTDCLARCGWILHWDLQEFR